MAFIGNKTQGVERQAEILVTESLLVQLSLLQTFLPMDGWLVGWRKDGHVDLVATAGGLDVPAAHSLERLLVDNWPIPDVSDGFCYRPTTETDQKWLGLEGVVGLCPKYVFKSDLRHCWGGLSAVVAGFLSQRPLPADHVLYEQEIVLCLRAMAQILNLHAELASARQLVHEIRENARIDALTQICNRSGWDEQFRDALCEEADVAVGFLDLDLLKFVNDVRGHMVGDELLRLTARTIQATLRNGDCVARIGGDEFAIMLHNVTKADANDLKARLELALMSVNVSASIGVALKSEAGSLQKAMQLADTRMYKQKRAKKLPGLTIDRSIVLE